MILERVNVPLAGGYEIDLPKMMRVKQHFNADRLEDIEGEVVKQMQAKLVPDVFQGKRVAVAAGSRGIANLAAIVKSTITQLKAWGAEPFIVPAMGSHGGATAQGQAKILADYGIDEKTMGVPVISSMDVVELTKLDNGMPVYLDKEASQADLIVVVNRIKPHTDFKGDFESGLLKMLGIGLGKHKGATTLHSYGFDQFHDLIPKTGKAILEKAPVAFGIGIVENAYDETAKLEVIPAEDIVEREKSLLIEAKQNMPKLLVSEIDVLIVDEIGKNISGSGMDPNITGRPGSKLPGFSAPPIQKVVVLDLTEKTHGNATGIGMADVTTLHCVNKIDFSYTYANCITSTVLEGAKLPLIMNNDKEAIIVALKTCNRVTPERAKIVRIKNTLELNEIYLSEAYLHEIRSQDKITILSEPGEMRFDEQGYLLD
ncbi:hypothetical protein J2S00_001081 [Caldalkalibacillus uzonensis]|uniref:LarA-like N-terminal domain-containing protein n=1 Tax=Caldalkalibacillus uzonensis TaxID=353224 RepID=A0ABU0CTD2_9BACI|nr:lactate racemase domain-containing protein [Caldalkalibacillus uzonensis]MDQ0338297.1 hypothetical protein [Caldalkalibacillus uzonensis]